MTLIAWMSLKISYIISSASWLNKLWTSLSSITNKLHLKSSRPAYFTSTTCYSSDQHSTTTE